jgi:MFS family permease
VARARLLVTVFFTLDGFLFANWVVRVPDVKAHVAASPGGLGLALLGVSAGAVVTMMVTGRLCARFGNRPMTVATAVLLSLAVMLPPQVTSVGALGAVLLVFGAGYGGLNVAMNSEAVDVIGRLGRPVMPTFHAAYSFGGLLGAVIGGAVASVMSAGWHLTIVGVVGLLVTAYAGTMLLRDGAPTDPLPAASTPSRANDASPPIPASADAGTAPPVLSPGRLRVLVAVFGTIALCTAYGEGALADWGALHLRTDLHTSASLAATGYASFSIAMVAGRLSGAWLLSRAGRTNTLAVGGLTAAGGMLMAALVPVLPLAIVGFILVGLGLANLFPAAVGQAGALTGPNGVAVASTIGYAGMLMGPPIIGFVADHTGLPVALTTITVLAALAAVIAVVAHRAEARWTAH